MGAGAVADMGKHAKATRRNRTRRARSQAERASTAARSQSPRSAPTSPARQHVLSTLAGTSVDGREGLTVLAELVAARAELTARIEAHIDALAADGVPWPVIADALGVTRQAARQAYARRHTAA